MRIKSVHRHKGFTLIETIVFLVVLSVGLTAVVLAFSQSINTSVNPLLRVKAIEKGQSVLDEILARRFDENTPTGGIPACNSDDGPVCQGIVADSDYDDVGDFNGYTDNSDSAFSVSATVVAAGDELGLDITEARRITVVVSLPDGNAVTLSAYKVNF